MIFEASKTKFGMEKKSRPFTGVILIQKLVFCHPGYGKKFESTQVIKYLVFHWVLGFPVYIGLFGHLIMATSDKIIAERFESLAFSLQTVVQFAVMMTYISLGNRFMFLYDRIYSNKFGRPGKLVDELFKCNMLALLLYFSIFVLIILDSIHNYYFNWNCEGRQLLNDKRFVCGLLLPSWYPFEVNSEAVRYALYVWFLLFCLMVVPHCGMSFVVLILLPRFMSVKIEHLKRQLDEVENFTDAKNLRKFRYFVDYYSEILECIKDMNHTYGYCLMVEYSLITLMIALLEYNIIFNRNYIHIFTWIGWFSMEMAVGREGQGLEDAHEELLKSVCNLPWYEMHPAMINNYKLFLGWVQMPVNVRAQPIANINHPFSLSVVHGTYSMLMFFLNTAK